MNASSRWSFSSTDQKKLIQTLTANLPMLRAKLDISQEEISKIIGISRQTYSSIENGKRPMSWQVYLSLVLFFEANAATQKLLHHLECFPEILIDKTNTSNDSVGNDEGSINADILQMFSKLDEQALNSVKTVLMVEYARCSRIPGEAVVKAFDGSQFTRSIAVDDMSVNTDKSKHQKETEGIV